MIRLIIVMVAFSIWSKFRTLYSLEWKFFIKLFSNIEGVIWRRVFIKDHSRFIYKKSQESLLLSEWKCDQKYRNRNSILNHEVKLKIVCHTRRNSSDIDKDFFGCHFWIYIRLHFLGFVLYHLKILESWRKM